MTLNEYFEAVLASQNLKEDSTELKELQSHREAVETLLRDKFADCSPTIRYGGSKAKGTLIREYYDLDLICYFPCDESAAGATLNDIFENVRDALSVSYFVEPKTSALRLKSKAQNNNSPRDFHIDVVPGRYTDDSKGDAFIYQASGEKGRLKTNLETHIKYVRESGVLDAIRLLKLWKVRKGLSVKQFAFDLMIIKLLKEKKSAVLSEQLKFVLTELKDRKEPVGVEDPANPQGNDLSAFLRDQWPLLKAAAADTLQAIENAGWSAVFGAVEEKDKEEKVQKLRAAAAAVTVPNKPWCPNA